MNLNFNPGNVSKVPAAQYDCNHAADLSTQLLIPEVTMNTGTSDGKLKL